MRIPAPNSETVGLIYVIRSGDLVKIGWARDVEKRRATLQTGCPDRLDVVAVFPGTRAEESECHRRFACYRCYDGGQEWFQLSDEVQAFIARQQHAHSDLQISIEDDARYRALWDYYARWPWDVLDTQFKRRFVAPKFLTANDIHRAIMTFDSSPVRLARMIEALRGGTTTVPDSEQNGWPAIALLAYLDVEPDPLDRRAMARLFNTYHPQGSEAFGETIDRAFALRRLRELKVEPRAGLR